jgi:maltooligosyltrehalose trehalohydrolase
MNGFRFGPKLSADGVMFRLWAPAARSVDLVVDRPIRMPPLADGWYALAVADAGAGTRYRFRIDGEVDVPDPASPFQPDDVGGASEVVDHDA